MKHVHVMKQALAELDRGLQFGSVHRASRILSDAIAEAESAAVQDPVAWRVRFHYGADGTDKLVGNWKLYGYSPTAEKGKEVEPLYTHPAPDTQRQWVGLTQEEIENCYGGEIDDFARAVEAKLKEKNT